MMNGCSTIADDSRDPYDIDELATFDNPRLLPLFRTISEISHRRSVTKQVHAKKKAQWQLNKTYKSSMAHPLVASFHAHFRQGFADVVAHSPADTVNVPMFRAVNDELHQHHGIEDAYMFPMMRNAHPEALHEIDILESDHRALVALEKSILVDKNRAALVEYVEYLNDHLNREEMITVPYLMDGSIRF